jgi:hypothetical protein
MSPANAKKDSTHKDHNISDVFELTPSVGRLRSAALVL